MVAWILISFSSRSRRGRGSVRTGFFDTWLIRKSKIACMQPACTLRNSQKLSAGKNGRCTFPNIKLLSCDNSIIIIIPQGNTVLLQQNRVHHIVSWDSTRVVSECVPCDSQPWANAMHTRYTATTEFAKTFTYRQLCAIIWQELQQIQYSNS